MIRTFISLSFVLAFSFNIQAQLIPFQKEELIGLCDANDRVILEAVYEDVRINDQHKIISLLKNDLWGLYNFKGQKLLDHIIKKQGFASPQILSLNLVTLNLNNKKNKKTGLIAVDDSYAKVRYFINPNKPLSSYKPYSQDRDKLTTHKVYTPYTPIHHITKVYSTDGSVNFLDSLGQNILPVNVKEGTVISNHMIGVYDGQHLSLHNEKGQSISDVKYHRVKQLFTPGLISGELIVEQVKKTKYFHLLSDKGDLITKTREYFTSSDNACLYQDSLGCKLYDGNGKVIWQGKGLSAKMAFLAKKKRYIITEKDNQFGVLSEFGDRLLPDTFTRIQTLNQDFILYNSNGVTVGDSNLVEVFKMNSVTEIKRLGKSDVFEFTRNAKKGIVSESGEILMNAEWDYTKFLNCDDLIQCMNYNDTIQRIRKFKDPSYEVFLPNQGNIRVDCRSKYFLRSHSNSNFIYDMNGTFLNEFDPRAPRQDITKSPYEIKEFGQEKSMMDASGKEVLSTRYLDIKALPILKKDGIYEHIYFCQTTEEKNFPNCEVLNNNLEPFIPKGYTFPNRWVHQMYKNPGLLCVVNEKDVIKNKYDFKVGVINTDGQWVIKPFHGQFVFLSKNLLVFVDRDSKKNILYNAKGEIIGKYDLFQNNNRNSYAQNRIFVGNFVSNMDKETFYEILQGEEITKEYERANKIEGIQGTKELTKILKKRNKKLDELGQRIEFIFGYIDMLGNIKLPLQFTRVNAFESQKDFAFVSKHNLNGEIQSYLIDTSGNVKFSAPFERLDYTGNYYKAEKDGKYCLVDTLGNQQTEFDFDEIKCNENRCLGKKDIEQYLITNDFKIKLLQEAEKAYIHRANNDYYYVETSKKIGDSYKYLKTFYLFDNENNLVKTFEEIEKISSKFKGVKLPSTHICIEKKGGIFQVYNTKSDTFVGG